MIIRRNDPDAELDRVLDSIRDDVPDAAALERSRQRVWNKLSGAMTQPAVDPPSIDAIRGCPDVQALIPSFLAGSLPAARATLVQDHARECVPCRRALREAKSGVAGVPALTSASEPGRARQRMHWRWAAAAVIALAAVLGGFAALRFLPADPALAAVRVDAIEGSLYRVAGNWSSSAAVGEEIAGGQVFRTAKGSRAVVELADGSRVEMNERSELSLSARRFGTTLHLGRGSIIVEAAKQGAARRLYVDSVDCRVAVVGTIFSVNHGTKGSRVSVIEGEVRVRRSGDETILRPGDQISTHPSLATVPVATEISWSRHLDQHLAVLAELTRLRRDIANLPRPAPLRNTRLLDLVPPATAMFAAVPNVSGTLVEAHRLLRERLESSPALREWWAETMGGSGGDAELTRTMEKIRDFGGQFRDELVIAVQTDADGEFGAITILAELTQPAQFRSFLEAEIREATANENEAGRPGIRIVEDPAAVQPGHPGELLFWIHDDLLAASNSVARLRQIQSTESGSVNPFVASAFHRKLAESYASDNSWLLGVDLESVLDQAAQHSSPSDGSVLRSSGLLDARHLIVEGDEEDGVSNYRAVLSFDGPRHGVAAWLAEPAPMGALEFVSPDATFAAAFVAKNPLALTEDLFRMFESGSVEFRARLAEFEQEHGVSVTRDIAAPLGGEFAVALDGPVLPTPAWKVMVEVYDAPRLQQTLVWLVGELNQTHDDGSSLELTLAEEQAGGRTWYAVRSARFPWEVHYTFVDGYLVAAPTRALVEDAIVRREMGTGLSNAAQFTELLPRDGNANFSALAYQNLGTVLNPFARVRLGATPQSGAPGGGLMGALGSLEPSLVYAYGEQDRIVAASTRPGGLFGSDLEMLLGLQSIFANQSHVRQAIEEQSQTAEGATESP